jgi:cryptochrome
MLNGTHANAIYWFRKALRLHDNPALVHCLKSSSKVFPIFILDPYFVKSANVGPNRWRFLFEALVDLDCSLRKLNSRLLLLQGKP